MPKRSTKSRLTILTAQHLNRIPWLIHGFSTRVGGYSRVYGGSTLNLGFTQHDTRATVEHNREVFLRNIGAVNRKSWPLVTLRQIHSDLIYCISRTPAAQLAGDGLITQEASILLAVQAADCLPVILADVKRKAVGVFHAGWRGTLRRIVEKGLGEMRRCFGSLPRDIHAAIGPGIRGCCYQVGPEVRDNFESQFAYAAELFRETKESDEIRERYPLLFLTARAPGHSQLPKKIFLDLVEANRRQLITSGVSARSICVSDLCTACRPDLLFSHRAESGVTGRMLAAVGIISKCK